jgi:predicted esterase
LYEEAFQWYPSFDQLGDRLERPDPSTALEYMMQAIRHLVEDCQWPPDRIHLFGFGQGGSVASEIALKWWKAKSKDQATALASVASVSGPLLSFPTLKEEDRCPTRMLLFRRSSDEECKLQDVTALKKGFTKVEEVFIAGGAGMPQSKDEWMPIMRFWSTTLLRREAGDTFQVI